MQGWLFLWRWVEHVDSVPLSFRERELCRGDVCSCPSRSGEQRVSSGSLLSSWVSGSGAVSSGHQHIGCGSSKCVRLPTLCEGLLLSDHGDHMGNGEVSRWVLLSQRDLQSDAVPQLVVS